jgi:phage terminase large subunit GpA-like protein
MSNVEKITDWLYNPIERLTPVEWAETHRRLTKEVTDYDGPMSYRMTPYLIEIANSAMADDPSQIISIMKGSQLGFSIGGIFTILGWIIAQSPANTLFITENDEKLKDQIQGPINQMINSSQLANYVGNHNIREREAKGRRSSGTGDTVKGIKFKDGQLYTLSGQNIKSLSSWSIRYGLYDEVERWKGSYKSAGKFLELVEPRHRAYKDRRKLFFVSTPEVKQTSNIEPLHDMGDRRRYKIPCKHCGELIELKWTQETDGEHAGITYKRDKAGRFIEGSAEYICQECGNTFKEIHKYDMLDETYDAYKAGRPNICEWVPTAEPISPIYKSYQISSMYAPAGFYSWQDMARKWCNIHPKNGARDLGALQTFYNQELGLTWEAKGKEVSATGLKQNTRNYDVGIIPTEQSEREGNGKIVAITCAVDLNGIMGEGDNVQDDDVRLDYEVVGWCENGDDNYVTSYSIDHGSIGNFQRSRDKRVKRTDETKWTFRHGHKNNVWDEFEKVLYRDFKRDNGKTKRIMLCGVDTGNFTKYANEFVYKHPLCIGVKGKDPDKYTKLGADKKFYTKGSQPKLYLAEGDVIKDVLAEEVDLYWNDNTSIQQPFGYMNFPRPENGKYQYNTFFKEFEGEHKVMQRDASGAPVGFKWVKKHSGSANHFLDTRLYNMVMQKLLVEIICKKYKLEATWKNFCAYMKHK